MMPIKLPPTYFEQARTAEIRQYKPPLGSAVRDEHEPVKPIYHLTGRQLISNIATAPYKPEKLDWFRKDEYLPCPIPNWTYLYPSSSFLF